MIRIELEETAKGFKLWCNSELMRVYSRRGQARIQDDAQMLAKAFKSYGVETSIFGGRSSYPYLSSFSRDTTIKVCK